MSPHGLLSYSRSVDWQRGFKLKAAVAGGILLHTDNAKLICESGFNHPLQPNILR